jgi:DNA topoisomerase-1
MPRLRRSDSSGAGLHRVRAGRGFSYRDDHGHPVHDGELLARILALAIPSAWTDVWIAPYANGHIQATGIDAAGRRQYIYHPTWREQKDRIKFDRALALAESLPIARRHVTVDLRGDSPTRDRPLAAGWHPLSASDINEYVRIRTGGDFTAKDFRTLHGTIAAAISLAKRGTVDTKAARR